MNLAHLICGSELVAITGCEFRARFRIERCEEVVFDVQDPPIGTYLQAPCIRPMSLSLDNEFQRCALVHDVPELERCVRRTFKRLTSARPLRLQHLAPV